MVEKRNDSKKQTSVAEGGARSVLKGRKPPGRRRRIQA